MFGNLGNLANLMKSAKEFQGQLAKMQEELAGRRYEGSAGGGMVRATVNGKGALLQVKIDPQAVADVELLEDLVKAAVSTALDRSQEALQSEISSLTGGLNVPGLSDMLGSR